LNTTIVNVISFEVNSMSEKRSYYEKALEHPVAGI